MFLESKNPKSISHSSRQNQKFVKIKNLVKIKVLVFWGSKLFFFSLRNSSEKKKHTKRLSILASFPLFFLLWHYNF